MTSPRVMIVEDEFIIAEEIASIVEGAGYSVIGPVGSIDQAEARLSNPDVPDFAVVDANVRDRSSAPLVHRLREVGVPLCVCTGYRWDDLRAAFGNVVVIEKPVDARVLVATIRSALDQQA